MRIPVIYEDQMGKTYLVEEPEPAPPPTEQERGTEVFPSRVGQLQAEQQAAALPAEVRAAEDEDYRDLYLRAMAEMANFRRRAEARADERIEEDRRRLLLEFLGFVDNLERAIAHLDEPGLRRGVQLTFEGLSRFLEREGVEPIETRGQPFDPALHEAVAAVHHPGQSGHVVNELQRGYRYHDRLLRPARVVVAK